MYELRQFHSRLARFDAAAIHAHVDFDEHADGAARGLRRGRHGTDVVGIIDAHAKLRSLRQLSETLQLDRPHHLIGDEDIGEPRIDEHLSLVELGTKKVAAAVRRDVLRQPGTLQRLEVHAHIHGRALVWLKHPLQIGINHVEIDQELRCVEGIIGWPGGLPWLARGKEPLAARCHSIATGQSGSTVRVTTGRNPIHMSIHHGFLVAGWILTLLVAAHPGADTVASSSRAVTPSRRLRVDFDRDGNLYLCEMVGQRVRKIDAKGVLTTIAGGGKKGNAGDDGPGPDAEFNGMHSLALAPDGTLYLADTWNNRVRKLDRKTGKIAAFAGSGDKGFAGDGGPAAKAKFGGVYCIALDPKGEQMYIADLDNRRIRGIDLKTGTVRTVAGNGKKGVPEDGAEATNSPLVDPPAVAAEANGNGYVLERAGRRCASTIARGRSEPTSAQASKARPATAATPNWPPSTAPSTSASTATAASSSPTRKTTSSASTCRVKARSSASPAPARKALRAWTARPTRRNSTSRTASTCMRPAISTSPTAATTASCALRAANEYRRV